MRATRLERGRLFEAGERGPLEAVFRQAELGGLPGRAAGIDDAAHGVGERPPGRVVIEEPEHLRPLDRKLLPAGGELHGVGVDRAQRAAVIVERGRLGDDQQVGPRRGVQQPLPLRDEPLAQGQVANRGHVGGRQVELGAVSQRGLGLPFGRRVVGGG